jgi:prophage antirepressor-like protein
MKTNEIINTELGIRLNYWEGAKKNERVFVASQLMQQLGYKGGRSVLRRCELESGVDFVKLTKKTHPEFINQLSTKNVLGQRTGSLIMLYESGVWKLVMKSKKPIGIQTRNWLSREVLPSINSKGYYSVDEAATNPLSHLFTFTERNTQLKESKAANNKIARTTQDYAGYHNAVHKLVNNMTAKEIQAMFNSKESAREIIRQHLPENAATIALIDDLFIKYGKNLEEIESTGIHISSKQVFKALFDLGVQIG